MIRDSDHGTAQESTKAMNDASEKQGARHENDHNPGNHVPDKKEVPQSATGLIRVLVVRVVVRSNTCGHIVRRVRSAERSRKAIVKMRNHRNTF
jgi:hypothetical protein